MYGLFWSMSSFVSSIEKKVLQLYFSPKMSLSLNILIYSLEYGKGLGLEVGREAAKYAFMPALYIALACNFTEGRRNGT